MWNKLIKLLIFLTVLQIFQQFVAVECKSIFGKGRRKGRGKAAGIGFVAGVAAGHLLTAHNSPHVHHHHYIEKSTPSVSNPVYPAVKPTTTIEKGEILPNGCYKQIMKQPDEHDARRYIETEQLICPQNVATTPTPTYMHVVPYITIQQPQPVQPVVHTINVPIHIEPVPPNSTILYPQISNNSVYVIKKPETVHTPPQPEPNTPHQPSNVAPVVNNQSPLQILVQPVQPVAIPSPTVAVPPQVLVLSKKTGFYGDDKKKKNAANVLLANSYCFLLAAVVITFFF